MPAMWPILRSPLAESGSCRRHSRRRPDPSPCFQREYQDAQNEFWCSFASQQQQADQDWWACYNIYLRTPAWRKIRDRVLERDGYLCQGYHDRTATIAHHLTCADVGREFLFDLVALCRDYHEQFHRQDGRKMSGLLSLEEYEFQVTFTDD